MASLQQQVVPWSVDDGGAVAAISPGGFGNTVRRRDAAHRDECSSRSRILKKSPSVLSIHSDLASIRASIVHARLRHSLSRSTVPVYTRSVYIKRSADRKRDLLPRNAGSIDF